MLKPLELPQLLKKSSLKRPKASYKQQSVS